VNVLVAFGDFSRSLSAYDACLTAQTLILRTFPGWQVHCAPLTTAGLGFGQAATRSHYGTLRPVIAATTDAKPMQAQLGTVGCENLPAAVRQHFQLPAYGKVCVIDAEELCARKGLSHDPWEANTFGLGQMIAQAADDGAAAIFIGVGVLGTLDIGLGALEAIGVEVMDQRQQPLVRCRPSQWANLGGIRSEPWPHIPRIHLVTSGASALLGPMGAVSCYGQKAGLRQTDAVHFERAQGKVAKVLCASQHASRTLMGERASGEGGGLVFGLRAACDAVVHPVETFVPQWTDLTNKLNKADFVLLGMETLDAGTMDDWRLGPLLKQAQKLNKHVFIFANKMADAFKPPGKAQVRTILPAGLTREAAETSQPKRLAKAIVEMLQRN
jgi:glycerate kinase